MEVYKLSIVIPCYNENSRSSSVMDLTSRLDKLARVVNTLKNIEFIFIDDGSTDDTYSVIESYIDKNAIKCWSVYSLDKNMGKGYAVSYGFKKAKGAYIGFMDADLSTSLVTIYSIMPLLNKSTCFIGSRYKKGSRICNKRSFIRKGISKISRLLTSSLFSLDVADTQCGFKVFPAQAVKRVDRYTIKSRWLYDIELLYGIKLLGIKIDELSISWLNDEVSSRFLLRTHLFNIFIDFIKLVKRRDLMKRLLE